LKIVTDKVAELEKQLKEAEDKKEALKNQVRCGHSPVLLMCY